MAVLDLDISEAVKLLLVSILDHSQGIKESKKVMLSELSLKIIQGHLGLYDLVRGEGSGRYDKEGGNGKLHLLYLLYCSFKKSEHFGWEFFSSTISCWSQTVSIYGEPCMHLSRNPNTKSIKRFNSKTENQ